MSILLFFPSAETGETFVVSSHTAHLMGIGALLVPVGYIDSTGLWYNEVGSESNLHLSIDETIADDVDYIYDFTPSNNNYYECSLSNPLGIPVPGDVIVFWRGECIGESISIQTELRQGASTVIATSTQVLSEGKHTYHYVLTSLEKENITDWADLRLRITEVIS